MKNIEVEFRFHVSDENLARDFLDKLEFIGKSKQKDIYFDTASGNLYKRGIFIRTRNGKSLDFKFNIEDLENKHEDCDEHSFSLPLSEDDSRRLSRLCEKLDMEAPPIADFGEFVKINKLKEFVVIEKVREKFSDGEFTFSFDNVKEFGLFLEIESMATGGSDLPGLKKRMIDKVSGLDPKFIPTGYIEFFVRKLDFNLYKQGRYLFDEDKKND